MSEATALAIVDLQQAVFGGHGIPPAHEADRLLGNASALLQEARTSGVPVVHIQHCGAAGEVFEEGAPGWAITPCLRPAANEPVVRKRASNAGPRDAVRLAEDGHSTWPDTGRSAEQIIAAQNEALSREGALLSTTDDLVKELRASRGTPRAR
jgi:hypothetical protein